MKNNKNWRLLSPEAFEWMMLGAWLVGSGVDWILTGEEKLKPRDLDFIIPPENWQASIRQIKEVQPIRVNRFGGLKFQIRDMEYDLWPTTIDDFFKGTPKDRVNKALRFKPYTLLIEDPNQ